MSYYTVPNYAGCPEITDFNDMVHADIPWSEVEPGQTYIEWPCPNCNNPHEFTIEEYEEDPDIWRKERYLDD